MERLVRPLFPDYLSISCGYAHSNSLNSSLKYLKTILYGSFQNCKIYLFFQKWQSSELDSFFRKIISVNLCIIKNEEQLHIPKINAAKYGSWSLKFIYSLLWSSFSRNSRNQVINISISKFKALVKNNVINGYNYLPIYFSTYFLQKSKK